MPQDFCNEALCSVFTDIFSPVHGAMGYGQKSLAVPPAPVRVPCQLLVSDKGVEPGAVHKSLRIREGVSVFQCPF